MTTTFRPTSQTLRIALVVLLLLGYGFVASNHNHTAPRAGNGELCAVCIYGLDSPAPQPVVCSVDAAPLIGAEPGSYRSVFFTNPLSSQPHNRGPPASC